MLIEFGIQEPFHQLFSFIILSFLFLTFARARATTTKEEKKRRHKMEPPTGMRFQDMNRLVAPLVVSSLLTSRASRAKRGRERREEEPDRSITLKKMNAAVVPPVSSSLSLSLASLRARVGGRGVDRRDERSLQSYSIHHQLWIKSLFVLVLMMML